MRIARLASLSALLLCVQALAAPLTAPDRGLQALQWRLVGPFRGGCVDAVAGIPGDGHVFYWGAEGSYAKLSPADRELFQTLKQQSDAALQGLHAFDDVHPKGVTALHLGHPAVRITLQHRDDD